MSGDGMLKHLFMGIGISAVLMFALWWMGAIEPVEESPSGFLYDTSSTPTSQPPITSPSIQVDLSAEMVIVTPDPKLTPKPPCEWEDSNDCVWAADQRGNGEGQSFYAWPDGDIIPIDDGLWAYVDERGALMILPAGL